MFMVCPQGGHVWVVPQPAQGFSGVTINFHPRAVLVLGLELTLHQERDGGFASRNMLFYCKIQWV